MEVIRLHHPYQQACIPNEPVVLVLGFFDGVHRGHQEVIKRGREEAKKRGMKLALLTFNHHPSIVFKKTAPIRYLSSNEQKQHILSDLGIDILYIVDFTSDFSKLVPQQFVQQYIVDLHAVAVVAGFDYTYGPKKIATMKDLPLYAKKRFDIIIVDKKSQFDEKISSTRIRNLIREGDVSKANQLLGRSYEMTGTVIHGDARGRTLGFPTANVFVDQRLCLPKPGVYVVHIKVGNQWHHGMASIGHNVTFEANRPLTVEVNILDFHHDIYGEEVTIQWLERLRSEIKFDSVDDLIQQLNEDEKQTRVYFQGDSK